jgi:RNA polymerase sigma-70 factor (ECF subfamily)
MDERRRKFEAEVLPHLDAAHNLARWLARGDADDIVQDAMLRAFRGFDGFRGGDARPWLLAIVRNCWRSAGAEAKRRGLTPLPEGDELVAEGPGPEAAAEAASERRRLDALIAALPEEFREVLILREMEDMAYRDIADVTGSPIGTVMSRLARARALLRAGWTAGERP